MRRAPASFSARPSRSTVRATTPSRPSARTAPRWLRQPFGLAPTPAPLRAARRALSRSLWRRSVRRFSHPFAALSPPPRALHGPSRIPSPFARSAIPADELGRGRCIRSRAPFVFAPARHSGSHSARRSSRHVPAIPRAISRPGVGERDTARPARRSRRERLQGPFAFAPVRAFLSDQTRTVGGASQAQQASLDARGLHGPGFTRPTRAP